MPCLHQFLDVLTDNLFYLSRFPLGEVSCPRNTYWVEPELRTVIAGLNVNMHRLSTVTRIKEETKRANTQHCRHVVFPVLKYRQAAISIGESARLLHACRPDRL